MLYPWGVGGPPPLSLYKGYPLGQGCGHTGGCVYTSPRAPLYFPVLPSWEGQDAGSSLVQGTATSSSPLQGKRGTGVRPEYSQTPLQGVAYEPLRVAVAQAAGISYRNSRNPKRPVLYPSLVLPQKGRKRGKQMQRVVPFGSRDVNTQPSRPVLYP